jgi:beta-lactamase superfamily II metal-dependent hydrolase
VLAAAQETRWTMINVSPGDGQADCHLIEFPDGRTALIDIADGYDAGGTAVAFLRALRISTIDLVVISHFHKDHYGRLKDLIGAGINVGRVAGNMPAPANERIDAEKPWGGDRADAEATLEYLRERKIP